jgi:hypothetical protein
MHSGLVDRNESVYMIRVCIVIKRACTNTELVLRDWRYSVTRPQNFHYDPRIFCVLCPRIVRFEIPEPSTCYLVPDVTPDGPQHVVL